MENIENTLETLGTSDDGTISYVRLPSDRVEEALKILEDSFYPYECVSIGSDVAKNPRAVRELNLLAAECIQEGVSVAAIDEKSNQIIAVSVNKVQENNPQPGETFFEKFAREKCKEKESTSLINTMVYCDSIMSVFDYLKVDKVLEIMFCVVSGDHRKRGVGADLIKHDLKFLEKLMQDDKGPKAAVALFTSTYSQKIAEKMDFEVIATINYKVLKYDGVKFSDKIDSKHPTIKLGVKKYMKDVDLSQACSRV